MVQFASYLTRVLCKAHLIFPRINGLIECLQTNEKEDHNATDDNRKSCTINRDKTDNITFQAKDFLVHGPYENFISFYLKTYATELACERQTFLLAHRR